MYTHKCHKKLLKNLVLLSAMHDIKFFIFRYNSYLTLDIYIFRKSNIWTLTTRWRWEGHLGNNLSFMILCQCMSMFRLFGLNPILTSSYPSCKKHPKKSRFGAGRSWASFCLTMTKCYEYELCFCVRVPIMARNCVAVWLSFVLQFWHWYYSESDKYIQILLWMGALTTSEYECWENSLLMASIDLDRRSGLSCAQINLHRIQCGFPRCRV